MVSPIELLATNPDRKPTFLSDKWNPLMCAAFGFVAACAMNWGSRRPVLSGIQQHIGLTGIGLGLGIYFDNKRNEYLAERDAVLRHYIELHPEDFPTPERKKWGQVLDAWVPIR